MTAATYLVIALAGLAGSPSLALSAGLLFGLVRGLAVLLSSRCRTAVALHRLHARLSAWEPASLRIVMLTELVAAVALGLAAGRVIGVLAGVLAIGLALSRLAVLLPRKVTGWLPRWIAGRGESRVAESAT
jgi:hypothetical protein